jgi:hypothetical protein
LPNVARLSVHPLAALGSSEQLFHRRRDREPDAVAGYVVIGEGITSAFLGSGGDIDGMPFEFAISRGVGPCR